MKVETNDYSNTIDIAKYVGSIQSAIPVKLKAGQNLKAGALIGGDGGSFLTGAATEVVAVNGAGTEGVLRYDVDATDEALGATMVIVGVLDKTKVETGNAAAIDAAVVLKDIQFVK